MFIDDIDVGDLSNHPEEAFLTFEQKLRAALEGESQNDRNMYSDHNGNYYGSYLPERYYVTSILAFLDEYDLNIDVPDITDLENDVFQQQFGQFFTKINYAKTRLAFRKKRIDSGTAGTLIVIATNYKEEIGKSLETIRKIVNQEVKEQNKKDAIFKKISDLQSEVDRDRTTYDALLGNAVELSKALGECAENLEPAVQKVERIFTAISKAAERLPALPKKDRQKLISSQEAQQKKQSVSSDELEDEIPF